MARFSFYGVWWGIGIALLALAVGDFLRGDVAEGVAHLMYVLAFGALVPVNMRLAFRLGYGAGARDGQLAATTGSPEMLRYDLDPATATAEINERWHRQNMEP